MDQQCESRAFPPQIIVTDSQLCRAKGVGDNASTQSDERIDCQKSEAKRECALARSCPKRAPRTHVLKRLETLVLAWRERLASVQAIRGGIQFLVDVETGENLCKEGPHAVSTEE